MYCAIKLYTNTLCFETNPVASVFPLSPRGLKNQQKKGTNFSTVHYCKSALGGSYSALEFLQLFVFRDHQLKHNNKKFRGKS
jgi:hypothetical protein